MDKSASDSLARVSYDYSYKLMHRYEFKVTATSSKTNIATDILGIVGIAYATLGICMSVAGVVITLYNELIVPKITKVSLNALYSQDAPTYLQIKSVFRIYRKTGSMVRMYTDYKAVSV
ncbi:MAG: hypothetical protein RSD22_09345 [Romboutsia sp.]